MAPPSDDEDEVEGTVGLDSLVELIIKEAESPVRPKRTSHLSASQKFPYEGNSTVKRIMASVHGYDPFEPKDKRK
ncbi:unnamed protein product [Cochlearia groenlandica]